MDLKQIENIVAQLKSTVFKSSSGLSSGLLKSSFKGSGLQFKEHQVYVHGDDVRFIDWKLLARTNSSYVKTFEEERNVEIVVILDASPTMFVGYKDVSKFKVCIDITALLYILAKQTGDKVHTMIIKDNIIDIPMASGEKGIVQFINALNGNGLLDIKGKVIPQYDQDIPVGHNEKLTKILSHLHKKREVIIFSDFINFLDLNDIRKLGSKRNMNVFKVESPLDKMSERPYTVWGKNYSMGNDQKMSLYNKTSGTEIEDDLDKLLGKKIRRIDVDGKYLEKFVKALL